MNENFHSSKDVQSQYFRDTFIFFVWYLSPSMSKIANKI